MKKRNSKVTFKSPSLRQQNLALRKSLERAETSLAFAQKHRDDDNARWRAEVERLKSGADDRMLAERRQLCNSIGQMVDAVSHAIRFVIGKEQL